MRRPAPSSSATNGVEFTARFARRHARTCIVPLRAVLGIYARETGQGMIFSDSDLSPEPPGGKPTAGPEERRRSHLKVVK